MEIEIKVKIDKVKSLLDFLKKNAKLVGTAYQIDKYFTPAHRDFLKVRPAKEWLRLRNENGEYSINYKNWYYDKDGRTNYCDEHETKVEDLGILEKIFKALDVKEITVVDKKRQVWMYKDYEIGIDEVKNLGNFVEIEYKSKKKVDPQKITEEMINFLKEVGCGEIQRNYQGYPFLLLFPHEAKFEKQ